MRSRIALWIVGMLFSSLGNAAIYIVNSNADEGDGTLRDAIKRAGINDPNIKDTIIFQLATESIDNRIIKINSPLIVPSNLVIDGTTQPGSDFGITNAKVILENNTPGLISGLIMESITDVEIYGIWFRNFMSSIDSKTAPILLHNASNIYLGAPGKGNYFALNEGLSVSTPLFNYWDQAFSSNVVIQGNIFDLDTTGTNSVSSSYLNLRYVSKLKLGGNNLNEGNFFSSGMVVLGTSLVSQKANFEVINNKFGYNYTESNSTGKASLFIAGTPDYPAAEINIKKNRFSQTESYQSALTIVSLECNLLIEENSIGIYNEPENSHTGIYIMHCRKINQFIIRDNTITNCFYGIHGFDSPNLTISNNSIYCTEKGIYIHMYPDSEIVPPAISINERTVDMIKGTATPLSRVEVFSTKKCFDKCLNGQTLIGTTSSDNSGNWILNINNSDNISATATNPDGLTSEFNKVDVDVSSVQVKSATCGSANGSITNVKITNAAIWSWQDENGNIVSRDTNLLNVPAGFYRLKIPGSNSGCRIIDSVYEIKSVTVPALLLTDFRTEYYSCPEKGGILYYKGTLSEDYEIDWLDKTFKIINNDGGWVKNLEPGTYYCRLSAKSDKSCFTISPAILINERFQPTIDTSEIVRLNSKCGEKNGSILGIKFNNLTNTATINWVDTTGSIIGNNANLQNINSGTYVLNVTDTAVCFKESFSFWIENKIGNGIKVLSWSGPKQLCENDKGTLIINKISPTESIINLTWKDDQDNFIGRGAEISVSAGNYQLFATDTEGCEQLILEHSILPINVPVFDYNAIKIKNDSCLQGIGSITGIILKGNEVMKFSWYSDNGNIISENVNLYNLFEGSYFLKVMNEAGCSNSSKLFQIKNIAISLPSPNVNDVVIIKNTTATLKVINPDYNSTYKLYSDNGITVQEVNRTGLFQTPLVSKDMTYYIQSFKGSCSSEAVAVKVKVVDKASVYVPTAFTPNKDGRNDKLRPFSIGPVSIKYFKVYNRWGQQVYSSTRAAEGWDGRVDGKEVNAGVYVWILEGWDDHEKRILNLKGTCLLIR